VSLPEPIEEQILVACVARLTDLANVIPGCWYAPRFVTRIYRPLETVNELPGYLVVRAAEESGADLQTIDYPGSQIIASMGLEVLAYGQGSESLPTDRVLIRLLAQAERALCAPDLFGPSAAPENSIEVQNTRRVLDHETEIGAPHRSLMSHLYRVRYFYSRGEP
jgi:hypothetical protein